MYRITVQHFESGATAIGKGRLLTVLDVSPMTNVSQNQNASFMVIAYEVDDYVDRMPDRLASTPRVLFQVPDVDMSFGWEGVVHQVMSQYEEEKRMHRFLTGGDR